MPLAASIPPITPVPRTRRARAPDPDARANGMQPAMKANEVIRIGRKRTLHANTVASSSGIPWSCKMPENSTIRMLLETTIPVIMITPIKDMMLSVLPVNSRIITTPARPGGIAMRMMNGSINDVNCAIRIR